MDFDATGQGGSRNILSFIYKHYWTIGFRTRLYERFCPEAYCQSLRYLAEQVRFKEGEATLDAGCGSGMLFSVLADRLKAGGGRYLGLDILMSGLAALKLKARQSILDGVVCPIQADLSRKLPFKNNSVFCIGAHFSLYTLRQEKDRQQAYREFYRILKPGGVLVTANPTSSYNAERIIRSSLHSLENVIPMYQWWIKKFLVYPLTLRLGLKHIERQIQCGRWHGYSAEELQQEVRGAGFTIEHTDRVYADSGFLVVGRKP